MIKLLFKHLSIILLVVFTLTLSACSSANDTKKFPTGRFTSSTSPANEYEFKEDNTWAYYMGGLMSAKGSYRIEGNQWIEEGTKECSFTGTYEWSYDGKKLSFAMVGDDQCAPRKEATNGQTFVLSD
jgi:hypothetical protein